MPDETPQIAPDAIQIQRAIESLRQERETFNQLKKHDEYWFYLKWGLGFCSIPIMFIVLFFSIYIIYNYNSFSDAAVIAGGMGLIGDIVGSAASIWKITMNPKTMTELRPVTILNPSENPEE
jgi:hypothetical protein